MSNFKSSLINDSAVARLGQPGGFAKLDENGLVTLDQLPGGGGLSWVPQTFTPNNMNPFNSGLPEKLDANGNPNVYHFSSSGLISTDGTTVFAVQQNERLWYRIDTDSWYHEKNTPQYIGASVSDAGTAGIVPLAQQGQQNFVFKGDGNWGGVWGNLNASGGPIPDGKYLIGAATAIAITLDEAIGEVRLFDYKGLVATNNITVGTNAQTFTDASGTAVAGPYVINTNNEDITFVNNTGTNAFTVVRAVGFTNPTVQPLTYGRVNASSDLANTTYVAAGVGTPIPYNATLYSSGMTFSGTNGITPSVAGRYRVSWLAMASSNEFANDGTYNVVQNGAVVGSIFIDQMQAAGVNQTTPFIDVDLISGQAVTLNYQPTSNDPIVFERGSYFQLTQLPTAVAPVVNTVAEYGGVVQPSNIAFSATTDTDVLTFTLPSAGVWEVTYSVTSQINASINGRGAWISDNSNVVIANSGSSAVANVSGINALLPLTQTARITTTGATTYKVRFRADNAGTLVANLNTAVGSASSILQNKVVYNKIAGQLPSTGQTVDYVFARLNADTTVANGSNIPFTIISGNIPMVGNEFILKAGKTYKLEATVAKTASDGAAGFAFGWTVLGVGPIGSSAQAIPPTATVDGTTAVTAYAIFTPTVDTQARVTSIEGSSRTAKSFHTSATITQLGSSAITTTTRVNVICRNKTAQSIPSSSWGNLTNWTEIQDPTNSFNPVTGVFTAPRTASYAFSTGNGFTVNSGTYVGQAVWLNNATQLYNFLMIAPTLAVSYIQTNGVIEMTAGQTLQARTFNGSGGAGNDSPSASNSWFTITEINPTF